MANKHGDFIWYELLTSDVQAAQAFYGPLLNWQMCDANQPDLTYTLCQMHDTEENLTHPIAGMLQLTDAMQTSGAKPAWLGYIAVNNVDESIEQLCNLGAQLLMPAKSLSGVGRLAMLADPQGVPFYIMRGDQPGSSMAFAFDHPRLGHCAWNELNTTDAKAAKHFYSEAFGWQQDGAMDMGELGSYDFLRHAFMLGAVMQTAHVAPPAIWNFYFRVADIDKAVTQITQNGGQIMMDPDAIPGGDYIVKGIDPQGALFSIIGQRKS